MDLSSTSMPLEIFIKEEKIEEDSDSSRFDVKEEPYERELDFNSEMDLEEKLIEQVRNHVELYDPSNKKYMDNNNKTVIWQKIATECGYESGVAAKEAWKKLRDAYRSSLKRKKKNKASGSASVPTQRWKYEQLMEFLQPYMKDRPRVTTLDQSVSSPSSQQASSVPSPIDAALLEEENPDEPIKETLGPIKKKKRQERRKEREELKMHLLQPEDSLKVFFDSMYISTKQLPPHLQRNVKRQLFNIVLEAEEAAAAENRS